VKLLVEKGAVMCQDLTIISEGDSAIIVSSACT